ncbi:MAG: FGGY family carbohydrate kinase, partial [Fidelibacterota bacterium]
VDDDGFECEDIELLEKWIHDTLREAIESRQLNIDKLNFATYGATLIYLDEKGNRVTPVYNYLKEVDTHIFTEFYSLYGGKENFCRKTASPALGMLNAGLQIYWLKHRKPEHWQNVKTILHFPQYLSYLFTGKAHSEYTSIGCHTGLWNFDEMRYHDWLDAENIRLPEPVINSTSHEADIFGKIINVGIGIHDSSASMVPFFNRESEKFLLISSGTWVINMNPFNDEKLTLEQLRNDCLCYMSIWQKQVMASRLFLGHIHGKNVLELTKYFDVDKDQYKSVTAESTKVAQIFDKGKSIFFKTGIPANYKADFSELSMFDNFEDAYMQLMFELASFEKQQIDRIVDGENLSNIIIAGGFIKNQLFIAFLEKFYPDMRIKPAEIDNSTALGAALVF